MAKLLLFVAATAFFLYVSRGALRHPGSHGFYRVLAWECMLVLLLMNAGRWFDHPFSAAQVVSWILLIISLLLALPSGLLLLRRGRISAHRKDESLFPFEKTTVLVTDGIYRYIRHPLYGSLLFLNWGIFFKNPTMPGLLLAAAASVFLFLTARAEEKENIAYFGESYRHYMTRSKMFVPFVF